MTRTQMAVAYAILLATCTAGIFHAGLWAACAGACLLALTLLIPQHLASLPQMRTLSEPVLVLSSAINASVAAASAYVFGQVARWVWGL